MNRGDDGRRQQHKREKHGEPVILDGCGGWGVGNVLSLFCFEGVQKGFFRRVKLWKFERLDYRKLAVFQLCDVRDGSCVQSCQITVESGTHPHKVSVALLTFLPCITTFVVVLVSVTLVFKLQTIFI